MMEVEVPILEIKPVEVCGPWIRWKRECGRCNDTGRIRVSCGVSICPVCWIRRDGYYEPAGEIVKMVRQAEKEGE